MKKMRIVRAAVALSMCAVSVMLSPVAGHAQEHGGGGAGSGAGDTFGDLFHVLRNQTTGQPILQKRWVEVPGGAFDWAYCPIPVTASGEEIPFAPLSCDPDPAFDDSLVEVDYFGRLSGGRTKERNLRMHFDEVIEKIKVAERVARDPAGRLSLGTGCTSAGCATWVPIDSPLENMSVYHRLMKYGHIQTDPNEVDDDSGGDPNAPVPTHPALSPEDYRKFRAPLTYLLPVSASNAPSCFEPGATACFLPQRLNRQDLNIAAAALAGAADKTGVVTMDLVQYFNRILRITVTTTETMATLATLPALIRECPEVGPCVIYAAPDGLPFPANERFVDFTAMTYKRLDWFNVSVDVIKPLGLDTWIRDPAVPLMPWLAFANPTVVNARRIVGFVYSASDALRTIEFIHNYEVPADLGWDFSSN